MIAESESVQVSPSEAQSDDVYAEFESTLASWSKRYASQPREEMNRLLLLALEREEIVSVGYSEQTILQRVGSMPIDDDVRAVIRHALLWVWKDEEMHAIYIRGALHGRGALHLRVRSYLQQWTGTFGGWASSVRQHWTWSQAPVSRCLAMIATWLGLIFGKVPPAVWKELHYRSFREFCLFNVDAERTAALCWKRLVELAEKQDDAPSSLIDDMRRMKRDEENHARVLRSSVKRWTNETACCRQSPRVRSRRSSAQ